MSPGSALPGITRYRGSGRRWLRIRPPSRRRRSTKRRCSKGRLQLRRQPPTPPEAESGVKGERGGRQHTTIGLSTGTEGERAPGPWSISAPSVTRRMALPAKSTHGGPSCSMTAASVGRSRCPESTSQRPPTRSNTTPPSWRMQRTAQGGLAAETVLEEACFPLTMGDRRRGMHRMVISAASRLTTRRRRLGWRRGPLSPAPRRSAREEDISWNSLTTRTLT